MKNTILTFAVIVMTNLSLCAQVLFVLSAADTLELNKGEKLRQTGVFLNEFYLAYNSVLKAGYTVAIATPNGTVATIDQESMDDSYWQNNLTLKKEALAFIKHNQVFNHPLSLEEALKNKNNYIGLVIPGGQGLMVDLHNNLHIPLLLSHFAETKKPTGLICHAPSLILTIPKESNPYVGFNVNSVSPLEEFVIEKFIMKGKPQNRKIAKRLKKMGLNYKQKLPKANYAVKDRNLVTSQNPFSSERFNMLYMEALEEYQTKN
ncbi:hypothetical protein [uncultured Arcticibacterium sp.]|uniref:hypothetical protein n=1 Tax=uncultured Arcticibacterium sp. TaxID=2173042 RepID=UPI0030F74B14